MKFTTPRPKKKPPGPNRVAHFAGPLRVPTGCRLILNDDGVGCYGPRWRYCQSKTDPGQSFCPDHRKKLFQQEPPRAERDDAEYAKYLAAQKRLGRS